MDTENWQTFELPGFGLRFQYPPTTPTGHAVAMDEVRVHVRSRESAEVYFEASGHLHGSVERIYEQEKSFVAGQLGGDVGPLRAATLGGHPAHEYSFRWTQGERAVILVEQGPYVYRFIYDPKSPLNRQVLGTIELL